PQAVAALPVSVGRYCLWSTAGAVAVMPKGSAAKSAYPMLAPPGDAQPDTTVEGEASSEAVSQSVSGLDFAAADAESSLGAARLYFSIDPMGKKLSAIEPWSPGEEPRFENADIAASNSPNAKFAPVPPVPFPAAEPPTIF